MNIKDFKKGFQINKEFLDTIDFIPFLKEATSLSELMIAAESYVFLNHIQLPPELKNEVFDYFSMWDFKEYLEKRYAGKLWFHDYEDYLIDFRDWEE